VGQRRFGKAATLLIEVDYACSSFGRRNNDNYGSNLDVKIRNERIEQGWMRSNYCLLLQL
jgi:hypothetical protein